MMIVNRRANGKAACTAIFCKKDMAMEQDKLETNPMSKLIKPRPKENDFIWIGHGISKVKVNAVKICIHP